MLKKENRLGKITRAGKNKLFTSPLFNIRVSDNKENQIRAAFIVSKKIDKRAVIRNRTKRVLTNAVKEVVGKLKAGKDLIIISKISLEPDRAKEVLDALESILKKAGYLNE
jgi:ribonuclease P protein component